MQLGGQTPLNLTLALKEAGVQIIGTSPDSIDIAEDREKFKNLLDKLKLRQPPNGTARTFEESKSLPAHRLSGIGAAFLCTWRTGHGDRLR